MADVEIPKDEVGGNVLKGEDFDESVGSIVIDDEASDDWLRARRLKIMAEAGDEDAAKELAAMERNKLVPIDEEESASFE